MVFFIVQEMHGHMVDHTFDKQRLRRPHRVFFLPERWSLNVRRKLQILRPAAHSRQHHREPRSHLTRLQADEALNMLSHSHTGKVVNRWRFTHLDENQIHLLVMQNGEVRMLLFRVKGYRRPRLEAQPPRNVTRDLDRVVPCD